MKLLSCHIDNFGKISNWDYKFNNGCNLICRDNGWGKSTFAAFIRVMLYGFLNQKKRNDLENERKRYKPWQGGVYGGNLTFEVKGKKYICYRVFGEKEKDDVFELRDAVTNLKSSDFSERLGEELFQLDQDSFERSICITQSNSDIRYVQTTGSMNAKLGNLVEDTEDINNFDKVDEKLTNQLNAMSPTRKTGSLFKQKEEIEALRFQIGRKHKIEQTIAELKAKQQEKTAEKEKLSKERDAVSEKQRRLVFEEKRRRYQSLLDDCQKKQAAYEEQRSWFPGELPDIHELEQKTEAAGLMAENRSAMDSYCLNEKEMSDRGRYQNQFAAGLPGQDEIARMQELVRTWKENGRDLAGHRLSEKDKQQLAQYKKRFSAGALTEQELDGQIRNWEQRNRKQEALSTKEASLNMAKWMARPEAEPQKAPGRVSGAGILLFIMAGLFVPAGIYLLLQYQVAGVAGLLLGFACAVAGILLGMPGISGNRKKMREKRQEQEAEAAKAEEVVAEWEQDIRKDYQFIQETEASAKRLLSQYGVPWDEYTVLNELHQLKSDCRAYRELAEQERLYEQLRDTYRNDEIERTVTAFISRFYGAEALAAGEYGVLLQRLEADRTEYVRLCEKQEQYAERRKAYERQTAELQEYLRGLEIEPEDNFATQLLMIQRRLNICMEREKVYREAVRERDAYVQKEGDAVLHGETGEEIRESADELRDTQKQIAGRLEEVQESIRGYDRQIDDASDELEEIIRQEAELEEKEEIYQKEDEKYRNLRTTQKYLRLAKESLTEKYMQPLMSGIKKYYAMLTGEEAEGFKLDANANLTIEEQGLPRRPEFFSTGLRDLLGLCIRMALVDAMYQENLPFILLDDPFVNYDDGKRKGGMRFLEKLSERYQIIYFSCREQMPLLP